MSGEELLGMVGLGVWDARGDEQNDGAVEVSLDQSGLVVGEMVGSCLACLGGVVGPRSGVFISVFDHVYEPVYGVMSVLSVCHCCRCEVSLAHVEGVYPVDQC